MDKNSIIRNSLWGTAALIIQNILFSLFFILIVRSFDKESLGKYIIANSMYGMVASFSSLGMGQWYMRNFNSTINKIRFTRFFIRMQLAAGIFSYFILCMIALTIYGISEKTILTGIIGINIIFDNAIYAMKCYNVVALQQKKNFSIQIFEAMIKLIIGSFLLSMNFSVFAIIISLVIIRFFSMTFFIHPFLKMNVKKMISCKLKSMRNQWTWVIQKNWSFIVIGSISVIFWSIGNILISRFLHIEEVGRYEIAFKLFALAEIIPVVLITTVFPNLGGIETTNKDKIMNLFKPLQEALNAYAVIAFLFIHTFAEELIPFIFGEKYHGMGVFTQKMFLTLLIFPGTVLQANLIVANGKEKIDMWINIISLIIHFSLSVFLLKTIHNANAVAISIFISFSFFYLIQSMLLIRWKWITFKEFTIGIFQIALPLSLFLFFEMYISKYSLFAIVFISLSIIYFPKYLKRQTAF